MSLLTTLALFLLSAVEVLPQPTSATMRFQFDYQLLPSTFSAADKDKLYSVANTVTGYLAKLVKTYPKSFQITSTTCDTLAIPSNVTGSILTNIDLYLIVTFGTLDQNTNSTGLVCQYDTTYAHRPVVGLITLNSDL